MQCLSSPTRSEIDKAHSQGIWLDIGVPSVRNLRRLSTARIVLWWLLAFSSIPLHLLYNSAVFSTLSSQQFNVFLVTSEFLGGASFNVSAVFPYTVDDITIQALQDTLQTEMQDYKTNRSSFVKLDSKNCVDTYSAPIISTNSDLILVSDYAGFSNSVVTSNSVVWYRQDQFSQLIYGASDDAFCFLGLCDGTGAVIDPQNLSFNMSQLLSETGYNFVNATTPGFSSINYCFSKRVKEHCKLQFSLAILIVVIVCNMMKTVSMTIIMWKKGPEPLVTLGDAIASFLDQPDVATERNCVAGRLRFEDNRCWGLLPARWDAKCLRWFMAASQRRWIICNVL